MKEQGGVRIHDETTSFRLLRVEHIMNRQNGVRKREGVWATTSWEGELARCTPPNNIVEMEADASFVDDGGCSKEDFRMILHLKVKGSDGIENSCLHNINRKGGGVEGKGV